MPEISKTFRVFESSTFDDFENERDILRGEEGFPELDEFCKDGFSFREVDLRWGVNTEAGLDQLTMKICLDEVKRCQDVSPKPNFIVMLGNRYGWIPIPSEIPSEEFENIKEEVSREDRDFLDKWFIKDENAVPPVYDLHTRRGLYSDIDREIPKFYKDFSQIYEIIALIEKDYNKESDNEIRKYYLELTQNLQSLINFVKNEKIVKLNRDEASNKLKNFFNDINGEKKDFYIWRYVEDKLRSILQDAVVGLEKEGKIPEDRKRLYFTSAVEQEVEEGLKGEDAEEHVFCFVRNIKHEINNETIQYSDENKSFFDFNKNKKLNEEAQKSLKDLKEKLKGKCQYMEYDAHFNNEGQIEIDDINKLCEDIKKCLKGVMQKQMDKFKPDFILNREIREHDSFAFQRLNFEKPDDDKFDYKTFDLNKLNFKGRKDQDKRISKYLKNNKNSPLVIQGESGYGKTALMAYETIKTKKSWVFNENHVISRFIGATPQSSEIKSLIYYLSQQIAELNKKDINEVPHDYNELLSYFHNQLRDFKEPLVIFLDAINQLSSFNNPEQLTWLPSNLSENVYLILSTITDNEDKITDKENKYLKKLHENLKDKVIGENFINLPKLNKDDAKIILRKWLGAIGRTLRNSQEKEILNRFTSDNNSDKGSPLFLRLAFEEAKKWKSYTVDFEIEESVSTIIKKMFKNLKYNQHHEEELVEKSLSFLACSRFGLSEKEMLTLLSDNKEVREEFNNSTEHWEIDKNEELPFILYSRLYFDLKPYLTTMDVDGNLLTSFYHNQFKDAVKEVYLKSENEEKTHKELSKYFREKIDPNNDFLFTGKNKRAFVELPFHMCKAEENEELELILKKYQWINNKINVCTVYDLIKDYDYVDINEKNHFKIIKKFLTISAYILREHKDQLPSQLYGRLNSLKNDKIIENLLLESRSFTDTQWFKPINQCFNSPFENLLGTIQGHNDSIIDIIVSSDSSKIVSSSRDNTIKIWDLETGNLLNNMNLFGSDIAFLYPYPKVNKVIIRSERGNTSILDLSNNQIENLGQPLQTALSDIVFTHDLEKKIEYEPVGLLTYFNVYDFRNNSEIKIKNEGTLINPDIIKISGDGKIIAPSFDNSIKIFDISKSIEMGKLIGHLGKIYSLTISKDSKKIVSVSNDNTLIVWDLNNKTELKKWTGLEGHVNKILISDDNEQIIFTLFNSNEIFVGNINSDENIFSKLSDHHDIVNDIDIKNKKLVSGSNDNQLILWDLNQMHMIKKLKGHSGSVLSVSFSNDGDKIISGSTDNRIKIWDSHENDTNELIKHDKTVTSIATSYKKSIIASASEDNSIKLWDTISGKELKVFHGHSDKIRKIIISADGEKIISASEDNNIIVWDIDGIENHKILSGHDDWVMDLDVTQDNKIVSASYDKTIGIWDKEGKVKILKKHKKPVKNIILSLDDLKIVSISWDKTIKIWDIVRGKELKSLDKHVNKINTINISPDNKNLISTSTDGTLRVWNLHNGTEEKVKIFMYPVYNAFFTPDNNKILFLYSNGPLGEKLAISHNLSQNPSTLVSENWINNLHIFADGKKIVYATDNIVKLWDLDKNTLIAQFVANSEIKSITISYDGLNIFAGDKGGHVYLFSIENISPSIPILTAIKNDEKISIRCVFCNNVFNISSKDLDSEIKCPNCQKSLKLNSFTINKKK